MSELWLWWLLGYIVFGLVFGLVTSAATALIQFDADVRWRAWRETLPQILVVYVAGMVLVWGVLYWLVEART